MSELKVGVTRSSGCYYRNAEDIEIGATIIQSFIGLSVGSKAVNDIETEVVDIQPFTDKRKRAQLRFITTKTAPMAYGPTDWVEIPARYAMEDDK